MMLRALLTLTAILTAAMTVLANVRDVDKAMKMRDYYIERRLAAIDSLKALAGASELPTTLMELAEAYRGFDNDSALKVLERGLSMTAGPERLPFLWKHAALLPLAGLFTQARTEYESIDRDSIPAGLLTSYYDAGRQLHSYMATYLSKYPSLSREEQEKSNACQDSLLSLLAHDTPAYRFNLAESFFYRGQKNKAQILLEQIVASGHEDNNLMARATHHLAAIAHERGDEDAYLQYLCMSVVADLKSATREVASLQELGRMLYEKGDVQRAYSYLSTAIANSVECGAPLRMIESAKALPIIERAHTGDIHKWRMIIYWIMAGMVLLMFVLFGLLIFLRHEMKQMRLLQANLQTTNNAKEVYISQFLQLCSIYMDKLTQFCKITERKLASGQADDLLRIVKSGKFVEEQTGEFYEVFDNAFLHIYPDFVKEVNSLLRPDAKITLKEGEKLNTDLRILAFMRLGIEDSGRIAQILNYSLNTVYAYRNRLKGRATDRDNFERNVIKIDGY